MDVAKIVEKTIDLRIEMSIDIPRIVVVPTGDVTCGFHDFDLDCKSIRLQPVSQEILIQHLHDHERYRLRSGDAVVPESRLEDYLVRGLIDFDDIDYDEHADAALQAGRPGGRPPSVLSEERRRRAQRPAGPPADAGAGRSTRRCRSTTRKTATEYEVHVSKGFRTLRPNNYTAPADETPRNFRTPVDEKLLIRGMLFGGFQKCLYRAPEV